MCKMLSTPPLRSILLLLVVIFLTTLACYGQGDRGLITGIIRDSSNAIIPGASVSATNSATGLVFKTETNTQGSYVLGQLPPGTYTFVVENAGFKQFEQTGVMVQVNDRLTLNVTMEVGAVTERVEITGVAPLLESASSSIGTVIDSRRVADLPLVHGNPLMLQFLAPGVTFNGNPAWTRPFDGAAAESTVNGSQRGGLEFRLDGVVDTGEYKGPAYQPSVEFIQEYKVETMAYDATEGHASAGFVNMSLKSGTNDLHGSAYTYMQNKALNANGFFNNMAGQPKAEYAFNRSGATAGGPVIRNRTFWFFGYEHIKHNIPYPQVQTVPLPAQKTGDFSQLLALGSNYQIYDPLSTTPTSGGRFTRTPFPGNIITADRLDEIGKKVVGFYPDPNQAGSADGGDNRNFGEGIEPDRFYTISARVDHSFNDMHRIFGRAVVTRRNDGPYRDYFPEVTGNNYVSKNRGAVLDYVYTINPQTLLNMRYGYTRYYVTHLIETTGFDVTTLGLPEYLRDPVAEKARAFPYFNPRNYTGFLSETTDGRFYNIHSLVGTLSRTEGAHFLRMGAEYRGYSFNTYNFGKPNGRFDYGSAYVNGPVDNSPLAPRGQGLAALLLGIPSGGYVDRNDSFAGNNPYFALNFQDDWKVTRKLTINAGLRYEYEGAPSERYDRSVLGFDFSAASPIAADAEAAYASNPISELPPSEFNVNGGLTFAGVGGQSGQLWAAPKKNFMPRIGFAYLLMPNTVLRGGYGIFFDFLGVTSGWSPIQSGYNAQTSLVPSLDNGQTYIGTTANPFPDGIQAARGNADGLATFLGKSISFFYQNPRTPYNQRWSFGIQHQFSSSWLVDVSYVGNRGTALLTARNLNGIPLQYLSTSPVRDQATINSLSRTVSNPFSGLIPGTSLNSSTTSPSQLLRPYPQFSSVSVTTNEGYSWYHALETKVEKRFSGDYTLMAAWTWGKNMEAVEFLNEMDPRPTEIISAGDRAHRLAINGIYELPFGKGKRFGGTTTGIAGKIIEGWQITGMYQLQSGQPLGFGDFIYYGNAQDIVLPGSERSRVRWFNTAGFETNSSKQRSYAVRYQPLRFSGLRSDKLNYLDCSVIKKTKITERVSVDFRSEFINSLNHPVFNPPDTNPTSKNFGVVTSAVALPRTIQFGIVGRF